MYYEDIKGRICQKTMDNHHKLLLDMFDPTFQFYQLLFEGLNHQIEELDFANEERKKYVECYHFKFNLNGCLNKKCKRVHSYNVNDYQYVICLLEILKR